MSANWGNPTTSSLYANFVAQVKERDEDLARAFDPAVTTPTNYPTGTVRWTSAAKRWEKWNGSAWVVLETSYAINISGNATNITGVAAPANGGTGLSSYTVGDLLFASGATTLSKLADIAVGNVLLSGGVGAAPSYGKVGLTTHVTGTLAVANGGTGVATLTGVVFGNGTGAFSAATAAQLVAAIGTTPVARATSADNGGITAFGGATGAITLGAGLSVAANQLNYTFPDASIPPAKLTQPFTVGTSVTAAGTAIDFTGIPSWAKRVTVICQGISTSGTSPKTFRLGSGWIQASGYVCSFGYATTAVSPGTSTTGFDTIEPTAAEVFSGHLVLTKISGNTFVCSGEFTIQLGNKPGKVYTGGHVTLSGTLDRIRITTNNGTDTFDAGSFNIAWE